MKRICLSLALILTTIIAGYAQSTTPPPATAEPVAVVTPAPTLVLPINTPVKLALSQTLSSATSRTNDIINFYVLDDVIINKVVVIRRGATATGKVAYAKAKGMMGKAGKLEIAVSNVRLADNKVTVELSAVQRAKGDGHGVAVGVTTGVVAVLFWPAAPFMLMRHGNDIQISAGTEVIAYTALDTSLQIFGE